MIDFKFDDLYKIIVNEAPIASYLRRPTSQEYRDKVVKTAADVKKEVEQQASAEQQTNTQPSFTSRLGKAVKAAAPGVGSGMKEIAKGVGSVAGEAGKNIAKVALDPRGAVKKAKEFFTGDDPMGMISKSVQNARSKSAGSNLEEFDKDVVKGLIAGQVPVKPGMKPDSLQTQTGTVQGGGSVTQGQVISGGLPGSTPPETSTGATTANVVQKAALNKRDPKPGDVFSIPGDFGRVKSFKIKKINGGVVVAEPVLNK